MKIRKIAILLAALVGAIAPAKAQSLQDLLGNLGNAVNKENLESAASGILEGLFTKTDITVADIAGVWQSTGSAVAFRSEEFLQKAGGQAASGLLEQKLDTYLKQYGLNASEITITKEGEISITTNRATVRGTITANESNSKTANFTVKFSALGIVNLGTYQTYVEYVNNPLSGSPSLKIMFDASSLQKIVKAVATLTKSKVASSASDVLTKYDGICVGFTCTRTGDAPASTATSPATGLQTDSVSGNASTLFDLLRNSRNRK